MPQKQEQNISAAKEQNMNKSKQLDIATKCLNALIQELFDNGLLDIEHITMEYAFNDEESEYLNEIIDELYND